MVAQRIILTVYASLDCSEIALVSLFGYQFKEQGQSSANIQINIINYSYLKF